jgi:outer membrane immunogenic protein
LIKALLFVAALLTPAAAVAQDFTGPRVEVTATVADVTHRANVHDALYGGAVGFDVPVGSQFTIGAEASADNLFVSDRTIGASARIGYIVNDRVLLFGKAGYENYHSYRNVSLDGLRVGGGVEFNLTKHFYTKIEGRYTDFSKGVGRVGATAGFGFRF